MILNLLPGHPFLCLAHHEHLNHVSGIIAHSLPIQISEWDFPSLDLLANLFVVLVCILRGHVGIAGHAEWRVPHQQLVQQAPEEPDVSLFGRETAIETFWSKNPPPRAC